MLDNGAGAVGLLEREDMAKAKKAPPVPEPDDTPKTLYSTKGRPSWHAWLKRYAKFVDRQVTAAVDFALKEQAKRDGFTEPMPQRISEE